MREGQLRRAVATLVSSPVRPGPSGPEGSPTLQASIGAGRTAADAARPWHAIHACISASSLKPLFTFSPENDRLGDRLTRMRKHKRLSTITRVSWGIFFAFRKGQCETLHCKYLKFPGRSGNSADVRDGWRAITGARLNGPPLNLPGCSRGEGSLPSLDGRTKHPAMRHKDMSMPFRSDSVVTPPTAHWGGIAGMVARGPARRIGRVPDGTASLLGVQQRHRPVRTAATARSKPKRPPTSGQTRTGAVLAASQQLPRRKQARRTPGGRTRSRDEAYFPASVTCEPAKFLFRSLVAHPSLADCWVGGTPAFAESGCLLPDSSWHRSGDGCHYGDRWEGVMYADIIAARQLRQIEGCQSCLPLTCCLKKGPRETVVDLAAIRHLGKDQGVRLLQEAVHE
jgi:hypothetical protein